MHTACHTPLGTRFAPWTLQVFLPLNRMARPSVRSATFPRHTDKSHHTTMARQTSRSNRTWPLTEIKAQNYTKQDKRDNNKQIRDTNLPAYGKAQRVTSQPTNPGMLQSWINLQSILIFEFYSGEKINQQKQKESQLQVEEMVLLLDGSSDTPGPWLTRPLTENVITATIGKLVSQSVSQ